MSSLARKGDGTIHACFGRGVNGSGRGVATSSGAGAHERTNLEASGPQPVRVAAPVTGRKENLEKELGKVEGKKWLRRLLILVAVLAVGAGIAVYRSKTKPPPPAKPVKPGR